MDASTYEIVRNVSFAVVIGALHAYSAMQRQKLSEKQAQTDEKVAQTEALVNLTYADVKVELDQIRASVETLTVKLNGGDRRAPRAAVTDNLAAAQQRRWTDPTTPRPAP